MIDPNDKIRGQKSKKKSKSVEDLSYSEEQKLGKRERDDLEDGEYEGGKEESRKR